MTLNQIINRVKTIALNHKMIRAFHYGNVNDFFDNDNSVVAGSTEKKFSCCILQDNGVTIANNILSVSFIIFLLDLVHVSEDSRDNEQDVQSDMLEVAQDLFSQFDFSEYSDWRVTLDNQVQLVREEQPDYVAGVALTLSIETPRIKDICAIPTSNPAIGSQILWGYFNEDPFSQPSELDFQFTKNITSGSPSYSLDFTANASSMFLVVKEPVIEPEKSGWVNTQFNYGVIPDQVFRAALEIGQFRYYISRDPVVIDSTNTIISFNV